MHTSLTNRTITSDNWNGDWKLHSQVKCLDKCWLDALTKSAELWGPCGEQGRTTRFKCNTCPTHLQALNVSTIKWQMNTWLLVKWQLGLKKTNENNCTVMSSEARGCWANYLYILTIPRQHLLSQTAACKHGCQWSAGGHLETTHLKSDKGVHKFIRF